MRQVSLYAIGDLAMQSSEMISNSLLVELYVTELPPRSTLTQREPEAQDTEEELCPASTTRPDADQVAPSSVDATALPLVSTATQKDIEGQDTDLRIPPKSAPTGADQ